MYGWPSMLWRWCYARQPVQQCAPCALTWHTTEDCLIQYSEKNIYRASRHRSAIIYLHYWKNKVQSWKTNQCYIKAFPLQWSVKAFNLKATLSLFRTSLIMYMCCWQWQKNFKLLQPALLAKNKQVPPLWKLNMNIRCQQHFTNLYALYWTQK